MLTIGLDADDALGNGLPELAFGGDRGGDDRGESRFDFRARAMGLDEAFRPFPDRAAVGDAFTEFRRHLTVLSHFARTMTEAGRSWQVSVE